MAENIKQLQKKITIKYIIALSIIALLSTTAFYALQRVLKESNYTGQIVNISGKQRMLSQHIALDIHRIHSNREGDTDYSSYQSQQEAKILEEHITEMFEANKKLSTGILSPDVHIQLSSTIYNMYFGEMNVASRVQEYLSIAKKIIRAKSHEEMDALIKILDSKSETLLKDLNKIVQQYQLEGEVHLGQMHLLETVAWIVTIITLLLEVIFIFQPMVRQIILANSKKDDVLQHLEDTVELRTLHLQKANETLNNLALHDALTGLRNRFNLETDIQLALDKFNNYNAPYGALMFDIDWFKTVNDTYGHDVGDKVLVEFSNILISSVREEDKVYRAGGEEFVILLNRISYEDIIKVAEKIRSTIEKHIFNVSNETFSKTISGGLFHSSLFDASNVKSVLKFIDTALYASKINGRNRITIARKTDAYLEKEPVIPSTIIKFENSSFSKILDIQSNKLKAYCNVEKLLHNEQSFLDMIHPLDIDILKDIPQGFTKAKPYISTVRILNIHKRVTIHRVEVYEENDATVLKLEESVHITEGVSDSTHIKNLHAMLENTDDFIYFKDRNHVFTGASKTLIAVTSVNSREEFIGKTDYDIFDKALADEYFTLERKVFDGELDVAQEIQHTVDNDGNKGYVDNRKYPMHDEAGNIIGLFGIARVVTNIKNI